jgi:hypothetical protein
MQRLRTGLVIVAMLIADVVAGQVGGSPPQPALASLLEARAPELAAADVQRIVARSGRPGLDIQVLTSWGASYFGWPRGVAPVAFEVDVGGPQALTIRADGYSEANRARYAAAFDAIVPEAVRFGTEARAKATRPKP